MNDFTKDDLEQILSWSVSHFEQIDIDVIEMERLFSLSKKIQTMIDNYCEHDTHETSALIKYCYKCNHSEFIAL